MLRAAKNKKTSLRMTVMKKQHVLRLYNGLVNEEFFHKRRKFYADCFGSNVGITGRNRFRTRTCSGGISSLKYLYGDYYASTGNSFVNTLTNEAMTIKYNVTKPEDLLIVEMRRKFLEAYLKKLNVQIKSSTRKYTPCGI